MPIKGNQFKSNSFREEPQAGKSGSKPSSGSAKPERERPMKQQTERMPLFDLRDGRIIKIAGLFCLVLSVFFLIAFTSYLFTWQQDQSYVSKANGGWGNLFKTTKELLENGVNNPMVDNWLGKFGALLSNQFIFEWFGVASFLFVFVFFIIGYRLLFKIKLFSVSKMLAYTLFAIVFLSVTLGFFHAFILDYPHFLEGEFGFWTNRLLAAQIGQSGTGFVLIFLALTVLIIAYNIDFKLPERKEKLAPMAGVDDVSPEPVELVDEEISLPVEWPRNGGNRVKDILAAQGTAAATEPMQQERLQQEPLQQAPVFHQPVVLKPEVSHEPQEETEIPLTIDVERPMPILNIEKSDDDKAKSLVDQFGMYDHKLDLPTYKYPTIDLLENYGSSKIAVNSEELEANKNKIVETLNHYNIEIDKIKATIGPTVTLYEIIPAPGVRISKIKNLEDDIALSLAALGIRIIAPMPGKGTIGIEVPNQNPEMVSMRSILATEKWQNNTMDLPIALGKTISNEVFIADLAKMPHLLVAGATGQGKSVGINAILVSLLYKKHPAELKFVLVDPKKVELTLFRKIERHFLAKLPDEADAIITDTKKVVNTLNSLCIEMDQRYDLLKDAQVRNLKEYNTKFVNRKIADPEKHRYLPFIVLVIDEFADLMMTAGKEVEQPIARIAQLARAVGIHLVIATQRPSVNVITGTIKANFPARLAFRVLSKIDSRTILDAGGADQLIGRGDMLLSTGSDLIRLQCAFVDTPEVERISDFIGNQRGYPSAMFLPEYVGEGEAGSSAKDFDPDDRDPMFEDAARLIVLHQQGSTSLIQRKMKLGYNRAGRIIDQLEAAGIVGPFEGSKARDVLYPDEYSLERHLEALQKPRD
ncbi:MULTISPECIES: DNA translocase FtsK 4TM domain-containing protein [unclassified Mucilaginibacter]|uniref:FtsK/SpoIIIE family DNA translocase n=1 Tax=unclassified Mucilaginibacter TaxID=2617802 RepID=UPI002AC98E61|nr:MULTISPECIES: DNA translocase FtsK 4TM domain-containing protein [unclassified Mucilaginibacter]MEB0262179.1 DNA translocase FtsK 4TM domain-containing protein [Mucilaginibacter sp. 10I4]MEB0277039.1 DNA translocase FtsK 4TM domain-containing protein [Mucilaginibacter sp. 10B2]MEB0302648.1 DNA translocase FtsK 4TM domain-containing protein [Mucilaginibacter sp. 5C4]WPX25140.1 DNA translocase FtsK 4TM domain-containing protein [Mucilaginibacter sp. 5C4]